MTEPMELMAPGRSRQLFVAQFARLADVPPEVQQFGERAEQRALTKAIYAPSRRSPALSRPRNCAPSRERILARRAELEQ